MRRSTVAFTKKQVRPNDDGPAANIDTLIYKNIIQEKMAAESTPMDGNGAADAPLESSVTAIEYINRQLELEKEARELMPYSFETCTFSMGPLRQPVRPLLSTLASRLI